MNTELKLGLLKGYSINYFMYSKFTPITSVDVWLRFLCTKLNSVTIADNFTLKTCINILLFNVISNVNICLKIPYHYFFLYRSIPT